MTGIIELFGSVRSCTATGRQSGFRADIDTGVKTTGICSPRRAAVGVTTIYTALRLNRLLATQICPKNFKK
jgi:hypothetical protein